MDVTVKPPARVGTTTEVDLFYNTPARRKFMRTEKRRFNHIDGSSVVLRIVAVLTSRLTCRTTASGTAVSRCRKDGQKERRLSAICGTPFLERALAIEWQHGDLTLRGWVAGQRITPPAALTGPVLLCEWPHMMRDRPIQPCHSPGL